MLGRDYHIVSLAELGCSDDIPETEPTLEGNAKLKAHHIHNKYNTDCFADDTGLEVEALGGEPGVISARYAGAGCASEDNMRKVLRLMTGKTNREARFRTVICLLIDGKEYLFEGRVDGVILESGRGERGFGYDPIFKPEGYDTTFAEMSIEEKNLISHRARAITKMMDFFKGNINH